MKIIYVGDAKLAARLETLICKELRTMLPAYRNTPRPEALLSDDGDYERLFVIAHGGGKIMNRPDSS